MSYLSDRFSSHGLSRGTKNIAAGVEHSMRVTQPSKHNIKRAWSNPYIRMAVVIAVGALSAGFLAPMLMAGGAFAGAVGGGLSATAAGALAGGVTGALVQGVGAWATNQNVGKAMVTGGLLGAAGGALSGATGGIHAADSAGTGATTATNLSADPTSTVPTSTVPTSTVPTSTVPTSTVPTSTVPTSTVPTSTVPTSTVVTPPPVVQPTMLDTVLNSKATAAAIPVIGNMISAGAAPTPAETTAANAQAIQANNHVGLLGNANGLNPYANGNMLAQQQGQGLLGQNFNNQAFQY